MTDNCPLPTAHCSLIADHRSLITDHFLPLFAHCLAQLVLWLAVKVSLSALYGGSLHYVHYPRNFYLLRVPETYPLLLSVFGFAWIPVLLGFHRIANDFVRRSLCVVPVFFAGMFIVAQIYELRLYGEMIPVVMGALACVLFLGPDSARDQRGEGPCRSRDQWTAQG